MSEYGSPRQAEGNHQRVFPAEHFIDLADYLEKKWTMNKRAEGGVDE